MRQASPFPVPPSERLAKRICKAANARGVLTTPAPQAFLKDFAESGVVYEVRFWMDDPAKNNEILDSVRTNIWYEAQRNHLRIPAPARTMVRRDSEGDQVTPTRGATLSASVPIVSRNCTS